MSYSRSFKSTSYRFSTDDDTPSYSASSSRYSSGLGKENMSSMTGSLTNRNSLLNDLDSGLGSSSTRKKLRSEFDNPSSSFDYGGSTQSGSGYGSSRRFESAGALSSSYSRETTVRRSYLDDDDDDFASDKYSPRRLGMLSSGGRNQQQAQQSSLATRETASSMFKKYLEEDDDDNNFSISSSVNKRTRYSKLDDLDDKEDNYSIRSSSMRKYSSSSNASYLKDDPEAFYAELTSRTSNRLKSKRAQEEDDDEDYKSASRFLSKQSTREDPSSKFQEDDYLSTTSSHSRRQLSRLSSKEETGSTISSKPASRFLSKYASREQMQDDDDETAKYFTSPRKEFSRFSSREELSRDDDLGNGRESLLKYKKYSREESNASVLQEKQLLPELSRSEKSEVNAFSSLSFKTSRMFKDSDDEQVVVTKQSTSSSTKSSGFFDKENQSKSYLEDDENSILDAKDSAYYVIIDYQPPKSSPDEIPLIEGQRVTVLSKDKPNKWRIQTHNFKDAVGTIGFAPSCYLEPLEDVPGICGGSSGKDSLGKSTSVQQAEKKRKNIIKELVDTEDDFNRDMTFIANTYLKHMESSLMPKELRENRCELFGCFRQIANFHSNELSKAIQFYNQEEPKHIELAFLRMEREFDQHVAYCRDLPQVQQQMLKEGPFKEYFDQYSAKIKDDKRLNDHLKLPVQRINDYQLLIKELIKYTARLNENTKDLEKTLEMMQAIPQRAADLQLIQCIQGYRGNLHDTGRLLKKDWFKVIGPDNRPADRYCLLFKQKLLITDQQNAERGKKIYYIKNLFKLNDINAASGDDELSIVLSRKGGEVTSNLPITLRAENTEQRTNWLNEFYNCRQLTREELADEREPEFTIVEDESGNNKDALCRKSSTERQAKLQKADSKRSNKSFEAEEVSDEQVTVVRLADETTGETPERTVEQQQQPQKQQPQLKDDVTLENSESKQDASQAAASSGNPSRQNSKQNSKQTSRQNSTRTEEPDESNAKDKDETYKRQQSRDSPGLPKPQKSDQQPQKMNSLSRQSTQQELNRKLSVSSSSGGAAGEKTPDNVSRQNSTAEPKSSSRLSSRRSSVDKSSTDKILDKLADKSAAESTANLSRKSSTKEAEPTERPKLSREGSRRSSVKRQESRVQEDFQVYEESTSVPLTPETNGGSGGDQLQRKSSSRKASIDKPTFKRELQDVTVNTNETVILECELAPCKDQLTLEWLKDGKVLNIAGRYKSSNQNNVYTLQINKAIARDSGLFALTATSPYAQTVSNCKVTVKPLERQNTRPQTPDAQLTPSAPVFKIKLKDTELKEGSTVRFELQVAAEPRATLKFFKDDKPLKENDRVKIEYTSDEACEIVIENCKQGDAGAYRVEASNSEGKDSTACSVTVSNSKDVFKGLPDEPVDQNHNGSPRSASPTSESKNLSTSRMSSNPSSRPRTPAFKWFRDGDEFDASERFLCQFNEDEDTIGLIFQHVTPEDAGLYTCVASTQGGKISCSAELTVQGEVNRLMRDPEPPKFKAPLVDSTVNKGSMATIEVKVTGFPKPTVIFEHNDQEIKFPSDKHKLLYEDDDTMTLIIKDAQPEDAGQYKVTAKNELDQVQDSCQLTVQSPPKFLQNLENQDVVKGKPLELVVKVQGCPKPECTFFKDGKPLDDKTAKNMKVECKQDGDTYTFIARCDSADLSDAGNYSVSISNDCGSLSSACAVGVNAPPEITGMKDVGGQEGDTVNFRVQVTGSPKPSVVFLKDGKPIDLNKEVNMKIEEEEGGYHRLTIAKLNKDQCAKITVVAQNSLGEKKADARLDIKCKPEFLQKLNDVAGKEGDSVDLVVKMSGFPIPDVVFKFNGKPIDLNNRDKYELQKKDDGTCVLKIKDLKPEDAGKISCVLKSPEGETESSCALQVNTAPKFTSPLKNAVGNENEKISLKVKVTGFPKPELTWFHNNKKLIIDDKHIKVVEKTDKNGETESELIISGSVSTDSGKYKCKAKNIIGEVSTEGDVLVSSMPIFTQGMTDVVAVDKQKDVEFSVKLKKQPIEPVLKWYLDDKPVAEDDPRFTLIRPDKKSDQKPGAEEDGDEYKLIIKEASPELASMIKCEARNQFGVSECYASFQVKKKPHFIQELAPIQYAELDKPLKLKVKASGWPKPNCQWKNIEENTSATITISEDSVLKDGEEIVTSIVEIEKLTIELCGDFECVAVNEMGEVVTKGSIKIGKRPELLKDLQDLNVKEGDVIEFEVKISSDPEPEISWFRNGQLIGKNDEFSIEKQKDDVYKLVCKSAKLDYDRYEFHVEAKNPLGECTSGKATLSVAKSDSGDAKLKDKTKKSLSGEEDDGKNKKKSSGDDLLQKDKDKKKSLAGKSMDSFDLDGTRIPKIKGLTDAGVSLGESITLSAIITGKPEIDVQWSKSGISLGSTDNIVISKGDDVLNYISKEEKDYLLKNLPSNGTLHSLTIKNVVDGNLGDYTLACSNKYGNDEKTVNVSLKSTTPVFLVELPDSLKVKEGTPLRLEAKIDGSPMPAVKWYKDGKEIFTNNLNDQLNTLIDPLLSAADDANAKKELPPRKDSKAGSRKGSLKGRKDSTASSEGRRSRKDSVTSGADEKKGDDKNDKKLKRLSSMNKSVDKPDQQTSGVSEGKGSIDKSQGEIGQFESGKTLGTSDQPTYCVTSNDIFNNDRIKIDNYSNGVCVLTIDKTTEEDAGVYSVKAVNRNGQATSDCKVHVVSKYYREYSPPASVKHKMKTDPNYKPPVEFGLRGRKPNEHFDFKSETNYQIGNDTYVLQYRDTNFPLRIREYLRIGQARSASLNANLKEAHWGYAHPDTGFYPTVSIRERRKFIDVMDEEIKDEKTGDTTRSQPMRLIREIPTSNRGYGQVTTLRSEVARNDSKEDLEDLSNVQPISVGSMEDPATAEAAKIKEQKENNQHETEAQKLVKKRRLKQILKSEVPFFREKIKDTTSAEDRTVTFRCFAVGKPSLSYTWFKHDHLLTDDAKIRIRNLDDGRSELEIADINEYDYGRYKVLARNDYGSVVCQALLKPPNAIHSIPNEASQPELDYLIEIDKERKNAQFKEEEDPYSFVGIYARGRFSLVLKAAEKATNRPLACKAVLDKDLEESGMKNELKILSTLCHERIARLESAARFRGLNVIAMEPLSGIDVLTYLSLQSTFTEALITKIISQVSDAVEYLHFRGIALLELQPDNVVMVNAAQPFIKLVDFANARYVSAKGEDNIEVNGNVAYLAPEVLLRQHVTYAADVWSIGVLTYILLSGQNPFAGESDRETHDNVCFVRFNYNRIFKQTSQEAIRFLIFIFKKDAEKRPTIEEVQNNRWLLCDDSLSRKREAISFPGALLNAFSLEFHSNKENNSPAELAKICGV